MSRRYVLSVALLLALAAVCSPALAGGAPSAPPVPEEVLKKIEAYFEPPGQPRTREEQVKLLVQYADQMDKLIAAGEEALKKHPKAPNLHMVYNEMLEAGHFLVGYRKTDAARQQLLSIATRLVGSEAPRDSKIHADYFVTQEKVRPASGPTPKDAETQIRAYVKRYDKSKAEPIALMRATSLAITAALVSLRSELLDRLQKDHAKDPTVNAFLRRSGRMPPFHAQLTLLDGKKLTLPDDMKGKVLVVDFWATWCGPCVASLPHMKQFYAKYKPRGVEVLGISLDGKADKPKLEQFIKTSDLPWLHAFSGQAWEDPTARQYGVEAIPSVWVIGKDGLVVSDDARGDLENIVEQALIAGTSTKAPPKKN